MFEPYYQLPLVEEGWRNGLGSKFNLFVLNNLMLKAKYRCLDQPCNLFKSNLT